jgi:hypothetical protein
MTDILLLRLTLIMASVFFIVFAVVVGNVFVDSVVFNSVFIIINGTYSILLLIHRYWKIKLDPLEERIYKDFSKYLDRRTFKQLMNNAYLRTYTDNGQIVHGGNNFGSLYYIALVNPNYKVVYSKLGHDYMEVKEGTWIGVVEFIMDEKEKKEFEIKRKLNPGISKKEKKKITWGLDAILRAKSETHIVDDEIFKECDEPCYIYEFSLRVKFGFII